MSLDIRWQHKHFNQLTVNELYDALKLRIDVFVVEQTCYYPDLDDCDRNPATLHLLGYANNELVAYLRILPPGETYADYVSIGRVATRKDVRGSGLGHPLIKQGIALCKTNWPTTNIKISAQEHLQGYYQKHGFKTVSEMYLEDDIPHIAMLKTV